MSTVDRRIKYLRRNENGNLVPYYFGTEPRFIDSTLNSGTRNLEEQLLLGNNCTITTAVNANKTLYTVTKTFGSGNEYFKIISEYIIHNSNLLLYIVVDEKDGNYQIKTANSGEVGSSYNNTDKEIILADNNIYTLSNLSLTSNTKFNIVTEKLYLNKDNKDSLLSTKTIKGKFNGNVFTTEITIS